MSRSEICVTSKQGFVGQDVVDDAADIVMAREACNSTGMEMSEFINKPYYSIDPRWLSYSFDRSLEKMNLRTIDVAILCFPYEIYRGYFGQAKYDLAISKAFELYEKLISQGKLCEYGISGH